MPERKKTSSKYGHRSRPALSARSTLKLRVRAGVAIIVIAVVLAYLPVLSSGFVFDDDLMLTANRLIKAPDGLYRFWCTTEPADYWPVTNTTLWLEWRLWGMNPTGYHVTNLILHIAATLLMWAILRKLNIPGAFFAALLFAVHPVNVESVAWISQRKNVLAMPFFLLSILWYLRQFSLSGSDNAQYSRHTPCADPAHGVSGLLIGPWYWLSLLAFVMGILSKGSVVVLPVLLLGILWWLRPLTKWDLARTAPFFVIAVLLAGVNVWFQTHGRGIEYRSAGFVERLLGAGGVVWFYLYKAFLPLNLVFIYPQWHIESGNLLWWLPLVAALVVTPVLWWYREGWTRPILFAWGFFCVSLVPVLGFTDVGFMMYSLVSDHYQHIAIIGVIALAAAGWSEWRERAWGRVRTAAGGAAVAAAGTLMLLTYGQSQIYRNNIILYQATLEKNPECWLAQNNLGNILVNVGRPQEAIKQYEQALRLKPDYAETYNNLGNALAATGRTEEAIKQYEQALRIQPDYNEAYNNLGTTLVDAGRAEEAIKYFEQALRIKPNDAETHYNLGIALVNVGRVEEGIKQYEQALRLKSDYAEAHNNLGIALGNMGRAEEGIKHFEQALHLKPNDAQTHNNLAAALNALGQYPQAIKHLELALRLKPDYTEAYANLIVAYAETNRSSEAIATAQKALGLARLKGQMELAKQIEDWLKSYRAGPSK